MRRAAIVAGRGSSGCGVAGASALLLVGEVMLVSVGCEDVEVAIFCVAEADAVLSASFVSKLNQYMNHLRRMTLCVQASM